MYLVVFRNRKRADVDTNAYLADAARMEAMAAAQPGYLSFKSYVADDGEVVAVSEWENRASAKAWRAEVSHAQIQARGRREYYENYTVMTCENPETHHFP